MDWVHAAITFVYFLAFLIIMAVLHGATVACSDLYRRRREQRRADADNHATSAGVGRAA